MVKRPKNYGKPWTKEEIKRLRVLSKTMSTRMIAKELARSEYSIYSMASELHIAIKGKSKKQS